MTVNLMWTMLVAVTLLSSASTVLLLVIHRNLEMHPDTMIKVGSSSKGVSPCQSMDTHNATTLSRPIWVAGYPGSGNDLLRTIVEAITGFDGRDVYLDTHCMNNRTATCKTHWPVFRRHPPATLTNKFAETMILLIRNPARSLPSYFNYVWESEHNMTDHSQQAPEKEWILWRDKNFGKQIRFWKKVVTWWMDNADYNLATILPYEQLTVESTGPSLMNDLAKQLREAKFQVATDLDCQWRWTVQQKPSVKRTGHKYVPAFTTHQQTIVIKIIDQLIDKYGTRTLLRDVLISYRLHVEQNLRVVDTS